MTLTPVEHNNFDTADSTGGNRKILDDARIFWKIPENIRRVMSCKAMISAAVVLVTMTMVTVTANGAPFSLDIELTRGGKLSRMG